MSSKTKTTAPKEKATPALMPKLRFPEFRKSEGWPQQQLGSVATFFKGKGLPKSALTPDGKRPCIHYGELFTVYPEVIGAVKSRTDSEEDVFLSVENDVLMPTSDVTPSGLAKACCLNFENVILGGDILVIRTDRRSINGEFLARYIRHLERKVLQLVSGSTVFHLYASSMEKLVLSFPPEPAEQQKIAKCLSSVDELMAAQARKVDALKTHKKGLMQQLFPREGETQPRLRFPEFQNAGEWVAVPLGEIAEIKLGKMLDKQKHTSGHLLPYLNNLAVRWNEVNTSDLPKMYFNDRELDRFGLRAGDVVVCEGGEPGRAAVWDGRLPELKFQKAIHRVRFKVPFEPKILVLHLENLAGTDQFEMLFTGGGIKHLTGETFSRLKIPLIPHAEQQRIADCLTTLDDLIAAQTQKHEALKTHKKGLMQQLFPSLEEAIP